MKRNQFLFVILILLALSLRLVGINYGLPDLVFADEPHHINVALSFGSGSLNPHVFKYPTLWMYTLFFCYGIYFLIWSGFGFLASVTEFAQFFVWNPASFYLIARIVTALLGSAALFFIFLLGKRLFSIPTALLAVYIAAISPPLIQYSHEAKADMLMFFLSSVTWWQAGEYFLSGQRKNALLMGFFLGLAASSQYTALLLSPLLLTAHLFQEKKPLKHSFFLLAAIMTVVGFLIGTPFALLDIGTFLRDITDIRSYAQGAISPIQDKTGWSIFSLFGKFTGHPVFFGILFTSGLFLTFKENLRKGLFLFLPLFIAALFFALQNKASTVINYTFCLTPALALLSTPKQWGSRWLAFVFLLLLLPTFLSSLTMVRPYLEKSTQSQAREWIQTHISPSKRLLMDQTHTGPALPMTKTQVERLHEQTQKLNHPRSRYYKLMLDSHPGDGYEILRLQRTNKELFSMERHTEWSQSAYDTLNVEEGLAALKREGIDYVVWSSIGATRKNSPRLARYFDDLEQKTHLLKEFSPSSNKSLSPRIKIYRMD